MISDGKTPHMQQRAETDVVLARLEQSRVILAMRLADPQRKKYKVIKEALAFVGDVHDTSHLRHQRTYLRCQEVSLVRLWRMMLIDNSKEFSQGAADRS